MAGLSSILFLTACSTKTDWKQLPIKDLTELERLESSTADLELWTDFFSDKPVDSTGIYTFRNTSSDTTAILRFADTCSNRRLRLKARLMYACILHCRLASPYATEDEVYKLLQVPSEFYSREDHNILLYTCGSMLKNKERYQEALGIAFFAESVAPKGVLSSYINSLIGAILLINDRLDNAEHYTLKGIEDLPKTGFSEKMAILYTNLGVIYRIRKENKKSISILKFAFNNLDSNDFDGRIYTLGHLSRAWEDISIDSAIFYSSQVEKLKEDASQNSTSEQSFVNIRQLFRQNSKIAKSKLDSFFQSNQFENLRFHDQVELLEFQKKHADTEEEYQNINFLQEDIIATTFTKLNVDSKIHYLEFTQEWIDKQIEHLLPLKSQSEYEECFRLIEWDRQIDHMMFLETKRGEEIENNAEAYSLLRELNSYDFTPSPTASRIWASLGQITLQNTPTQTQPSQDLAYPRIRSFETIREKFESEDSLSLLTMFEHNDSIYFLGYHFNDWSLDKIDRKQLLDFQKEYFKKPYSDSSLLTLAQFNLWEGLQKRIIILPSPNLETFPYALISKDAHGPVYRQHQLFFCLSFVNCNLPSTSFSNKRISGFAYTDIEDLDPNAPLGELPGSYFEIKNLQDINPQAQVYYGDDVTEDAIHSSLRNDDLVYIAMHHIFSKSNRFMHGVQLRTTLSSSNDVKPKSTQLVILSACETGLGRQLFGLGNYSTVKCLNSIGRSIIYSDVNITDDYNKFTIPLDTAKLNFNHFTDNQAYYWKILL